MYTSGIDRLRIIKEMRETREAREAQETKEKCATTTLVYAAVAAFCVVFCIVYEQFSFGEYSDYMRLMFLPPLLGGALPFAVMSASDGVRRLSRVTYNLWNSGIAVLVSGCLIRGIIEVSGRVADYDLFYWLTGGALLAAALVVQVLSRRGVSVRR